MSHNFTRKEKKRKEKKRKEKKNKRYKDQASLLTMSVRRLIRSWTLFYHLPDDKRWTLASYPTIIKGMDSVEKITAMNRELSDDTIRFAMLFIMAEGISPMWEDSNNRNGGCFSYKVFNKEVPEVWRTLICHLCGHTLMKRKDNMQYVNGLTISPKKNFCIIKIWLSCCTLQDTSIIVDIVNLPNLGSIFRKHSPEF